MLSSPSQALSQPACNRLAHDSLVKEQHPPEEAAAVTKTQSLQPAALLVILMPVIPFMSKLCDRACWQGLVTQWDGAEAELGALQGEAVLRIASAIKVFEDKLQLCAPRLLLALELAAWHLKRHLGIGAGTKPGFCGPVPWEGGGWVMDLPDWRDPQERRTNLQQRPVGCCSQRLTCLQRLKCLLACFPRSSEAVGSPTGRHTGRRALNAQQGLHWELRMPCSRAYLQDGHCAACAPWLRHSPAHKLVADCK